MHTFQIIEVNIIICLTNSLSSVAKHVIDCKGIDTSSDQIAIDVVTAYNLQMGLINQLVYHTTIMFGSKRSMIFA